MTKTMLNTAINAPDGCIIDPFPILKRKQSVCGLKFTMRQLCKKYKNNFVFFFLLEIS